MKKFKMIKPGGYLNRWDHTIRRDTKGKFYCCFNIDLSSKQLEYILSLKEYRKFKISAHKTLSIRIKNIDDINIARSLIRRIMMHRIINNNYNDYVILFDPVYDAVIHDIDSGETINIEVINKHNLFDVIENTITKRIDDVIHREYGVDASKIRNHQNESSIISDFSFDEIAMDATLYIRDSVYITRLSKHGLCVAANLGHMESKDLEVSLVERLNYFTKLTIGTDLRFEYQDNILVMLIAIDNTSNWVRISKLMVSYIITINEKLVYGDYLGLISDNKMKVINTRTNKFCIDYHRAYRNGVAINKAKEIMMNMIECDPDNK